jgi:hypothetical protein
VGLTDHEGNVGIENCISYARFTLNWRSKNCVHYFKEQTIEDYDNLEKVRRMWGNITEEQRVHEVFWGEVRFCGIW